MRLPLITATIQRDQAILPRLGKCVVNRGRQPRQMLQAEIDAGFSWRHGAT
jgi:hypothetical protein